MGYGLLFLVNLVPLVPSSSHLFPSGRFPLVPPAPLIPPSNPTYSPPIPRSYVITEPFLRGEIWREPLL